MILPCVDEEKAKTTLTVESWDGALEEVRMRRVHGRSERRQKYAGVDASIQKALLLPERSLNITERIASG